MAGLLELLEAQQDTADELLVLRPQVSQQVKKASRPRRLRHATQYRSLLPYLVLTYLLRGPRRRGRASSSGSWARRGGSCGLRASARSRKEAARPDGATLQLQAAVGVAASRAACAPAPVVDAGFGACLAHYGIGWE